MSLLGEEVLSDNDVLRGFCAKFVDDHIEDVKVVGQDGFCKAGQVVFDLFGVASFFQSADLVDVEVLIVFFSFCSHC